MLSRSGWKGLGGVCRRGAPNCHHRDGAESWVRVADAGPVRGAEASWVLRTS